MTTKMQNRVSKLKQRRFDPVKGVRLQKRLLEKAEGRFDSKDDVNEYIAESMSEVEAEYTKKTFEESNRVRDQIAEACKTKGIDVSFRNQGSVTNNTHIRFFSDVDLLVFTEQYVTYKSPLQVTNPYKGDPLTDLQVLRKTIEERLVSSFPKADVDKSGTKAVAISGGSLSRKIDVIPANWYDTQEYRNSNSESDRGLQILDLNGPKRLVNFPFLHNREIENKDQYALGGLRKLIRFVKSARYDADTSIKVSSYDIAALCFNISGDDLRKNSGSEIGLISVFLNFSEKVAGDSGLQSNLYVPNKTRLLFGEDGIKSEQLKLLNSEVRDIWTLAQARVGAF